MSPPRDVTVLVTSAGVATAANVTSALRAAPELRARILAVDMNPLASGLFLADQGYVVPPTQDPAYLPRLVELCRDEKVDVLLPLFSGEIALAATHGAALARQGIRVMVPPLAVVETCVDKARFQDFLEAQGFPAIPRYTPDGSALPFPLFIKPRQGSSSRDVHVVRDAAELAFHLAQHPDSLVQKFIPGTEYTVDCLVHAGVMYACVPRVRVNVKDGKSMVGRTVEHPRLVALVTDLVLRLGLEGPCNVQCLEDAQGALWLVEVNPRMAAGGLPLTVRAGANIPALLVRLALGETVAPVLDYRRDLVMVRYLTELFLTQGPHGYERP